MQRLGGGKKDVASYVSTIMKRIRYSKYVPDPAGEMSMEDLLSALSDYLLQSGFQSDMWFEMPEGEQTLDDLRRAIEQALMEGDSFDEEMRERLQQMAADGELDELIEKLIERMQQEDYISIDQPPRPLAPVDHRCGQQREMRRRRNSKSPIRVSTSSRLQSLLRNLLGSLGKSSFGRHDTRDLWPPASKPAALREPTKFGDTLNLDITATLSERPFSAKASSLPLNIEYSDLQVHQCEYQSSCATVLMLDCSHSMILYGEDRFTPAKKVAMALSRI